MSLKDKNIALYAAYAIIAGTVVMIASFFKE
jgi:hypothetical protein